MALTLRELLDSDVLRAADPAVLCGHGQLDRTVRWVHSSEIYEIGSLLSGGELLLTTGLGLAGADGGARRYYVREIAARGVTGVALELGRTFSEVPPEMVDEAAAHELPLIALRSVVPFVRITEAANTAIVDYSTHRLRHTDAVSRILNEALIDGAGIAGLLDVAGGVVGTPLVLVAAGGALVAAHGVDDDRSAWSVVARASFEVPVTLHGQSWGRLLAGTGSPLSAEDLVATLDRTAVAVALAILRTGSPRSERDRLATALLTDLVDGVALGRADTTLRAGLAGFHPATGYRLVGVAVDAPETGPALAMIDQAARVLGTAALRARVLLAVLGLVAVPPGPGDPVLTVRAAVESATRRSGAPQVTVALGPSVAADGGPEQLGASLRDARAALGLAGIALGSRPGSRPMVTTSRELALEVELAGYADRDRLAALVRRTIGPLVDWDATHPSDLVRTLEVYLRHGGSPTRTAAALHLGRQSLYQRIDRIAALLGYPPDGPDVHPALLLAACAHRVLRAA